jgi:Ni/Fe-hydrogenase subunit HybB-like protein
MRERWRRFRRVFIRVSFVLCVVGVLMATFDVGRSVGVVLAAIGGFGVVTTPGGAAGAATGGD